MRIYNNKTLSYVATATLASSLIFSAGCEGDKTPTSSSSSSSSSSSNSSSSTSSSSSSSSSSNSSSSTSSGHVIYDPKTPIFIHSENIGSNFDYTDATPVGGARIGVPNRREVFVDDVCTSSTGRLQASATGFNGAGYFDFDNTKNSRIDYATVFSDGGPRHGESIVFHFSNGTNSSLPMQLWVNGKLLIETLEFPSTGSWSTWNSLTLAGGINGAEIQVSLIAKSNLGGPHIDTTAVDFSYDCQWECWGRAPKASSCPSILPGG